VQWFGRSQCHKQNKIKQNRGKSFSYIDCKLSLGAPMAMKSFQKWQETKKIWLSSSIGMCTLVLFLGHQNESNDLKRFFINVSLIHHPSTFIHHSSLFKLILLLWLWIYYSMFIAHELPFALIGEVGGIVGLWGLLPKHRTHHAQALELHI
jgi:hypothetical protein